MGIKIKEVYTKELYLVSDNTVIRTIPKESGKGFVAYRKMGNGEFELKSKDGKMNNEIALVFTNALTIKISRSDYYDKTRKELQEKYMKNYEKYRIANLI